ncbi:hypothetical protein DYST_02254 [Dyella terrae]|nr:hypothetical protein DYST_02254 [Dyella terrae]
MLANGTVLLLRKIEGNSHLRTVGKLRDIPRSHHEIVGMKMSCVACSLVSLLFLVGNAPALGSDNHQLP